MLWLLLPAAFADEPALEASLNGDVKLFFLAGASPEWFGLSDDAEAALDAFGMTEDEALELFGLANDPFAQGTGSARLKGEATWRSLRLDAHWAIAAQNAAAASLVAGSGTGVGLTAPELVRLTWVPDTGRALQVQHRIDRLALGATVGKVDLTFGRQPISFGTGRFFTPLDLVNPFHPATIDSEYKPGVDAVRVDAYAGVSTAVTVAAAWAGEAPLVGDDRADPELDDLVLAANGRATVGVTDLLVFAGAVRGEPVFGLGAESAIGAVGVHGEATVTLPEDDPFLRAVIGATHRPTTTTTVMAEAYVQTFGAADPAEYLDIASGPRFARGEVWQMGQVYAAVSVAQEITPLVLANAAAIANLRDPSALLVLGGSWSVADNADLVFGAYIGAGERPDVVDYGLAVDPVAGPVVVPPSMDEVAGSVNSEFGLYPTVGYVQIRTYF